MMPWEGALHPICPNKLITSFYVKVIYLRCPLSSVCWCLCWWFGEIAHKAVSQIKICQYSAILSLWLHVRCSLNYLLVFVFCLVSFCFGFVTCKDTYASLGSVETLLMSWEVSVSNANLCYKRKLRFKMLIRFLKPKSIIVRNSISSQIKHCNFVFVFIVYLNL